LGATGEHSASTGRGTAMVCERTTCSTHLRTSVGSSVTVHTSRGVLNLLPAPAQDRPVALSWAEPPGWLLIFVLSNTTSRCGCAFVPLIHLQIYYKAVLDVIEKRQCGDWQVSSRYDVY